MRNPLGRRPLRVLLAWVAPVLLGFYQGEADAQIYTTSWFLHGPSDARVDLEDEMFRRKRVIRDYYRLHKANPQEILQCEDPTLRLGAFWWYLNVRERGSVDYQGAEYRRSELVGLLTAMTGHEFPRWWIRSLIELRYIDWEVDWETDPNFKELQENQYRIQYSPPDEWTDFRMLLFKHQIPPTSLLRTADGNLELVDQEMARHEIKYRDLSADVIQTVLSAKDDEGLVLLFNGGKSIAYLDGMTLMRFNNRGELLWKQYLWGVTANHSGEIKSTLRSRAEMVLLGDSILVYGASVNGTFVECLYKETGAVLYRFSRMEKLMKPFP
jgi:hypothetical protein